MDVLVLLEESPDPSPVLARVDTVPVALVAERRVRDVVTLYGAPSSDVLALALAAVVESHRTTEHGTGAFRHLGVWAGRGAVGDAAWRDRSTGELMTRDLDIPLEILRATATQILSECGQALRRLIAGLSMPDWPEGARRAINISLGPIIGMTAATRSRFETLLDTLREADGLAFEYDGE